MNFLMKSENEYARTQEYLKNFGCYKISKHLEIHHNGDITICCFSWLPKFCGNIITDSIEDIINNSERLAMISDMSEGKFTNCNDYCPFISQMLNDKVMPGNTIVPLQLLDFYKNSNSIIIHFCYDLSCNLQCPSCRNNLILHKLGENKQIDNINDKVEKLVDYLLEQGEKVSINITGSGDAFASPTYWNYLKTLSTKNLNENLTIKLMTNGILMTESRWNQIKPLWNNITHITVSIDAFSNETYSKIRINGSKDKLDENLKFLNEMIISNSFKNFIGWSTSFTVQKSNYKEIKDYINWQLSYEKLTGIYFNSIRQWGHLDNIMYDRLNLNTEDKILLKEILKDDIFKNKKVYLGDINSFR